MDGNYSNGGQVPMGQGGAAAVEQSALGDNAGPIDLNDWRAELPPRHRVVNYIMETIKEQLPFLGPVLYEKTNKAVVEFEEMVYTTATSQYEYLRMIFLEMRNMERKYFSQTANSGQDSINQTAGNIGAGDWQEEVYQKIKSMKDMYLLEMNEMYVKVATKMKQLETLPQLTNEHFEKLNFLKHMLERFIQFVQLSKNDIHISHKDRLGSVEKQIISILHANKPRNIAPLQPEQLPQPHMNSQPQSQISRMQQTHETGKTGAGDWQEKVYQQNHENEMNPPLMQPMNMQTSASVEQLIQKLEKLMYEEQIDLNIYPNETVSCEGGGFEDMDCR